VEWVETIGRTVEEAKDRALDQLGVDVQEAEFEILEEPSKGLFGRLRGDARVRARVAPRVPRPKQERRQRRGRGDARKSGRSSASTAQSKDVHSDAAPGDGSAAPSRGKAVERSGRASSENKPRPAKASSKGKTSDASSTSPKEASVTVSANEQAEIIGEFLEGLVEAFGYEAQVVQEQVDDETVEVSVTGDELGLLIGPKGQTLSSVQDLARTVLQRRATGTYEGRVRIDIAGYRERRREALARFTEQMAAKVLEEGAPKVLEPMHPADRKVVHDTANGIAGVHTASEGEDRERRVVIMPGDD
jgi:spoIIIJ-associated protein